MVDKQIYTLISIACEYVALYARKNSTDMTKDF